jgi:glycosyltransferase involved in cell wall biosynthesis
MLQQLLNEMQPMTVSRPTPLTFVPTPGDHYSLATGSATMSVVHELVRKQLAAGGEARIVVGHNTQHDIPDGACVEVHYPPPRTRGKKLIDAAFGRIGLARVNEHALYRPAADAIGHDFTGAVLVYNAPGGVVAIKKRCPRAKVCLYAVNALFGTYSDAELRRFVKSADRIICCSQYIADDINKRLPSPSPNVKVVRNGVNTRHFVPPPPRQGDGPATILFIGRMVPQKGADLLLKAARLLHGKTKPFKVRLVGSKTFALISDLSPYERELRDLAEPIKDAVEFQGSISRDRLTAEYRSADIFCVPSNWDDPLPLTVLEAMSSGLPVVGSRRGGIPEAGAEEILYFSPPDVEELAQRLDFFIKDPQTRSQWGAKSRARAEVFDWQNQYETLITALGSQ